MAKKNEPAAKSNQKAARPSPASRKRGGLTDAEKKAVAAEFKKMVNMTPAQIEKFLATKDSKRVGFKADGAGESVGHQSGRHIIAIKGKKIADLDDADYKHMKKVVGYVHRHCAQGPAHKADVNESKWRYSLMNWGHDPLKGGGCGTAE